MLPSREEWLAALEARHGKEAQARFSAATVAVCGLGGLGSNVAIALARAGVGKLILLDFDRVDLTNLHRQQYRADQIGRYKTEAMAENLGRIAPYTELVTHTVRLDRDNAPGLLAGADVVCEAFDRPEQKATGGGFGDGGLRQRQRHPHPAAHLPFLSLWGRDQRRGRRGGPSGRPGDGLRRAPGPHDPAASGREAPTVNERRKRL